MMLKGTTYTFLIAAVLMLSLAGQALAVDDPLTLLPRNHEISGWVKEGPDGFYYDFSLERILEDRIADIVNDYSLIELISQYYTNNTDFLEIRIYNMSSPEQAYGLYSVFGDIEPGLEGADIVIQDESRSIARTVTQEMRVLSDREVHLLGDNHFIQIIASDTGYNFDLLYFANKIQTKFDMIGASIEGTEPLHSKDKIFGSERLIGGYDSLDLYFPVGHFDPFFLDEEGVRCLQADYRLEQGKMYRQLVFEYPDVEKAKEAYLAFTDWSEDFNYFKRLNYADSLGSVVAKNENDMYIAGFRDGLFLRVFHGLEDWVDVKTVLEKYRRKG